MERERQLSNSCRDLLKESAWIVRQAHIHASVNQITGLSNKEAYAASRITHLTVHDFLKHFCSTFPNPLPWRLCLLPRTARRRLHTMLHIRLSLKASPLPKSTITPQPSGNGKVSADGSKSHPTSTSSRTPFHSLKYLLTKYAQESFQLRIRPFKN